MSKKIGKIFLIIVFIFSLPMFSESINSEKNYQNTPARKIGASLGTRLSVLGISPVASLIANRFELEAACGLSFYGFLWKDYRVGLMPQVSFGYTSPLFKTGWKHGVGLTYSYFSDAFSESLGVLFTSLLYGGFPSSYEAAPENVGIHTFSIYYKSGWQFKKFSIYFRFGLPLFVLPADKSNYTGEFQGIQFSELVSGIVNLIPTLLATSFVTQSIGVRWLL